MTPQQAEQFRYNVLDLTKVWSHKEFPLRPIGKIVLNENPQNYFAEIEQCKFFVALIIDIALGTDSYPFFFI
jgi:catalase